MNPLAASTQMTSSQMHRQSSRPEQPACPRRCFGRCVFADQWMCCTSVYLATLFMVGIPVGLITTYASKSAAGLPHNAAAGAGAFTFFLVGNVLAAVTGRLSEHFHRRCRQVASTDSPVASIHIIRQDDPEPIDDITPHSNYSA